MPVKSLEQQYLQSLRRIRERLMKHRTATGNQLRGLLAEYGVDTYSKVAFAKLYNNKTPITAADLLNDRVLPYFERHELPMLRILTDRGTEYCGRAEKHDYQLYLALNDIEHTKTKAKSPQTNGICERFHKTILQEFYQIMFRKKLYTDLESLQVDLDE